MSGVVRCIPKGSGELNLSGLKADKVAIEARLTDIGVSGATVDEDAQNGFSVQVTDRPAAAVAIVCEDVPTTIRPVLMKVPGRSAKTGDPFVPTVADSHSLLGGLPFSIPQSAEGISALPAQSRRQLEAILSAISCAYPIRQNDDTFGLACDADGTLYLLGKTIVDGAQIMDATATPGPANWNVLVKLSHAGRTAIAEYTRKHNAETAPNAVENELVVVGSGRAVSIGAAQQPISTDIQISGTYDQSAAQKLVNQILSAPLPVKLQVTQVEQFTAPATPSSAPSTVGTLASSADAEGPDCVLDAAGIANALYLQTDAVRPFTADERGSDPIFDCGFRVTKGAASFAVGYEVLGLDEVGSFASESGVSRTPSAATATAMIGSIVDAWHSLGFPTVERIEIKGHAGVYDGLIGYVAVDGRRILRVLGPTSVDPNANVDFRLITEAVLSNLV